MTLTIAAEVSGDKMNGINVVGLIICMTGISVHVVSKALNGKLVGCLIYCVFINLKDLSSALRVLFSIVGIAGSGEIVWFSEVEGSEKYLKRLNYKEVPLCLLLPNYARWSLNFADDTQIRESAKFYPSKRRDTNSTFIATTLLHSFLCLL